MVSATVGWGQGIFRVEDVTVGATPKTVLISYDLEPLELDEQGRLFRGTQVENRGGQLRSLEPPVQEFPRAPEPTVYDAHKRRSRLPRSRTDPSPLSMICVNSSDASAKKLRLGGNKNMKFILETFSRIVLALSFTALLMNVQLAVAQHGGQCACGRPSVPSAFEIDNGAPWLAAAQAKFSKWNNYANVFSPVTGDGSGGIGMARMKLSSSQPRKRATSTVLTSTLILSGSPTSIRIRPSAPPRLMCLSSAFRHDLRHVHRNRRHHEHEFCSRLDHVGAELRRYWACQLWCHRGARTRPFYWLTSRVQQSFHDELLRGFCRNIHIARRCGYPSSTLPRLC